MTEGNKEYDWGGFAECLAISVSEATFADNIGNTCQFNLLQEQLKDEAIQRVVQLLESRKVLTRRQVGREHKDVQQLLRERRCLLVQDEAIFV